MKKSKMLLLSNYIKLFFNGTRYKKQLSSFWLLIVVVISCKNNNDVNITIQEQIPMIVIEGYLTPGQPTEITVARNNLMDDELIFQSIWNANAIITDLTDTLNLLNIYYTNNNRNLLVNYCNEANPKTLKGDILHLFIKTINNDTLTSITSIIEDIKIHETLIYKDHLQIKSYVAKNKFSGFLRLDIQSFSTGKIYQEETKYYDCSQNMNPYIEFPLTSSFIANADSLGIRLFHIQKEYYRYQTSVDNAVSAYHDPFLIPENIKTNIKGGTGIFTYYTSDSCYIKIDFNQPSTLQ